MSQVTKIFYSIALLAFFTSHNLQCSEYDGYAYFDLFDLDTDETRFEPIDLSDQSSIFSKSSADTKILRALKSIERHIALTDDPHTIAGCCTPLVEAATGDENVNINATTEKGLSPLLATIMCGNVGLTKLFLNKGADTQLLTREGLSPLIIALGLYCAATRGHLDFLKDRAENYYKILKTLSKKSAALHLGNAQTSQEKACLEALSKNNPTDLIQAVKENMLFDAGRLTLFLFFAVRIGCTTAVESLIDSGPLNVNTQNSAGDTPLHEAVRHNNKKMARLLLNKKADAYSIENNEGLTAQDTAEIFSPELLALLEGKEEPLGNSPDTHAHQEL